ncbi:MAG: SdpI family protein, partial [Myxococcales bacterium]
YGSRLEMLLLGPVLLAAIWGLCELLPRIDPRLAAPRDPEKTEAEREGALQTALALVIALLALMHGLIIAQSLGLLKEPPRALAVLMAGFLILFGNFIGRLRPSWFVGIRTPWTLSSDAVWRRTHRLAGRLMVPAGLLVLLLALTLPASGAFTAAIVLLLAAVLAPAVLSFFYWRKSRSL